MDPLTLAILLPAGGPVALVRAQGVSAPFVRLGRWAGSGLGGIAGSGFFSQARWLVVRVQICVFFDP